MTELINRKNDNFDILGLQIEQMRNMANAVESTYDRMRAIEKKVVETDNVTTKKLNEITERQDHLDRHIVFTRGEASKLKSLVLSKSERLTQDFFKTPVSEQLFDSKKGHTTSYIWIVLKNKYDVSTYPEIPHIEFENAMRFVSQLTIDDFPRAYYRLTPKTKEIAEKYDQNVEHVYFEDKYTDDLFND